MMYVFMRKTSLPERNRCPTGDRSRLVEARSGSKFAPLWSRLCRSAFTKNRRPRMSPFGHRFLSCRLWFLVVEKLLPAITGLVPAKNYRKENRHPLGICDMMKEAESQVPAHSDELARTNTWTFGERTNMRMERGTERASRNPKVCSMAGAKRSHACFFQKAESQVPAHSDELARTFGE